MAVEFIVNNIYYEMANSNITHIDFTATRSGTASISGESRSFSVQKKYLQAVSAQTSPTPYEDITYDYVYDMLMVDTLTAQDITDIETEVNTAYTAKETKVLAAIQSYLDLLAGGSDIGSPWL